MSDDTVKLKLRAKLIKESIQLYCLKQPEILVEFKSGVSKYRNWRMKDFAKKIGASYVTVWHWTTMGKISPYYERELIKLKVLEGPLP